MTAATSEHAGRARRLGWLLGWVFCLGFWLPPGRVAAQIPSIPGITTKGTATAPTAESPEDRDARFQQWLKDARANFNRLNVPDAEKTLPEGVDASALADYRRDLEQTITGINSFQKILEAMPETAKALAEARTADNAWRGFTEKPPYSILMLDELVNQRVAIGKKATSYHSSLAIFTSALSGIQDEARNSEDAGRRAVSAAAEDPSGTGAATWKLEANRAKSRLLAVRAMFLRSSIDQLKDQVETTKVQLSLLNRQITAASKKAVFSDEDLETVKKAAADRQTALRQELDGIRKREQAANAVKVRMQAVKDELLKTTPEGTPLEETPDLALATVKMEASETRVDSLQTVAGKLETLDELESDGVDAYVNRKAVLEAKTKDARDAALEALRSGYDRMAARNIVFSNELDAVNADIGRQEARASARPADDPRLLPLSDVRASLWDKQAVIQRSVQATAAHSRMMKIWLDEFDNLHNRRPLWTRFSEGTASVWTRIRSLWSADVFTYNDTVMMGGVPSTEERGVTFGQFFIAFSAFLFTYFAATRIKNRLLRAVVRRGHVAEAQAKTLGNWLMIVVGIVLAVTSLHFLKIPLTVFAFFGGALAIGLGFGTQTLIKNFISGIIMLFERKIRVGDIVDIGGGIAGTIVEVNTRSSVLRGADGRETLVPNSMFLENQVTSLTLNDRTLRRMINVGVSYGTSPQQVISVLTECAERHGLVLKTPAPTVVFQDFGDNALLFRLYVWVALDGKTNGEVVDSDLRLMVEKRFGELGIGFPFPQRDIHLVTGTPLNVSLIRPAPQQTDNPKTPEKPEKPALP